MIAPMMKLYARYAWVLVRSATAPATMVAAVAANTIWNIQLT